MILWSGKKERFLRADGQWVTYSKQLRLEDWMLYWTDNYKKDDGHEYKGCHLCVGLWKRFSFGYFDDYYDGRWQSLHFGCLYLGRYS